MLDAVAENAARLCEANDALIRLDRWTNCCEWWPITGHSRRRARMQYRLQSTDSVPAEPSSSGKLCISHDLASRSRRRVSGNFATSDVGVRTLLAMPMLREGLPIGAIVIRRPRFVLSPKSRSLCLKPSPTRRSSPSRTSGCSRKSRNATRNCARPWSIRRQRPRCSASSAARRRTCSRSSMPSSRAPRGFVGSMTWCCDSTRATLWFHGLILVPYPLAASKSVLMSHSFAGCASMARFTFPTSARRTIFQWWVPPAACAPS